MKKNWVKKKVVLVKQREAKAKGRKATKVELIHDNTIPRNLLHARDGPKAHVITPLRVLCSIADCGYR